MNNSRIKILAYPESTNPYQDLLYKNSVMSDKCHVAFLNINSTKFLSLNLLLFPLRLIKYRFYGYKIFHLHWLYEFQAPPLQGFPIKLFFTIYSLIIFTFIKCIGFKLIYTVHDYIPHTPLFVNDIWMSKFVIAISHAVLVQSSHMLDKLKKESKHPARLHFIPIGNYNNIYPNILSQDEARKKLHIAKKNFVFMFFGRVEHYKGVDILLDTFSKLPLSNIDLYVVGPCSDKDYASKLLQYCANKNIHLYLEYIKDEEIQTFLNASDVIILPFREITSSSTVLLAYSFKKAVIIPRLQELSDLPKNTRFFYNNQDKNGLQSAMIEAVNNKSKVAVYGKNAYNYSLTLSWEEIAKKILRIYQSL